MLFEKQLKASCSFLAHGFRLELTGSTSKFGSLLLFKHSNIHLYEGSKIRTYVIYMSIIIKCLLFILELHILYLMELGLCLIHKPIG
jgi:hypothetical protein